MIKSPYHSYCMVWLTLTTSSHLRAWAFIHLSSSLGLKGGFTNFFVSLLLDTLFIAFVVEIFKCIDKGRYLKPLAKPYMIPFLPHPSESKLCQPKMWPWAPRGFLQWVKREIWILMQPNNQCLLPSFIVIIAPTLKLFETQRL